MFQERSDVDVDDVDYDSVYNKDLSVTHQETRDSTSVHHILHSHRGRTTAVSYILFSLAALPLSKHFGLSFLIRKSLLNEKPKRHGKHSVKQSVYCSKA